MGAARAVGEGNAAAQLVLVSAGHHLAVATDHEFQAVIGEVLALDAQTLSEGEGSIHIKFDIPDGYKLNPLITSVAVVNSTEDPFAFGETSYAIDENAEVTIPVTLKASEGTLNLATTVYYCEAEKQEYCLVDDVQITVPVTVSDAGESNTIEVEREIVVPEEYKRDS